MGHGRVVGWGMGGMREGGGTGDEAEALLSGLRFGAAGAESRPRGPSLHAGR